MTSTLSKVRPRRWVRRTRRWRAARLEAARRNSGWTELEETVLVPRARYLVHADTDELFTYFLGAVS